MDARSSLKRKRSLFARIVVLVMPVLVLIAIVSPQAFAQTTYVITDGDQVQVYTTYATDPADVLDRAGIELSAEDTYTTEPGDGVSEITVQRSQNITVYDRGEKMEVTSYGETVQALLDRLGIPSYGEYTVSVPLGAQTEDGMEISVDCVVQLEQTYTEEIPYEVTYCYDPTLPEGQQEVLVTGAAGELCTTANVVYVNAQESTRTVITEDVVKQPVNEIVVVGTGTKVDEDSNAPAIGDGVIVTAEGEVLTYSHTAQFKATAYTKTDAGCDDITATGTTVRVGTVAVDPSVVPYGTRMFIVTNDGSYVYGIGTAEDCGGAITDNRLDLYFDTDAECWTFGVRNCTVYFLD